MSSKDKRQYLLNNYPLGAISNRFDMVQCIPDICHCFSTDKILGTTCGACDKYQVWYSVNLGSHYPCFKSNLKEIVNMRYDVSTHTQQKYDISKRYIIIQYQL